MDSAVTADHSHTAERLFIQQADDDELFFLALDAETAAGITILALRKAHGQGLAEHGGRVLLKLLREITLQQNFIGFGAAEKSSFHLFNRVFLPCRLWQSGEEREVGFVSILHLSGRTHFRSNFFNSRQSCDLRPRVVVECRRFFGLGVGVFIHVSHILPAGNEDGLKHSRLHQLVIGKALQADSKGKHGNQRGDANRDSHGGKGIAQTGVAHIASCKFEEVLANHRSASTSVTSLPSAMCRDWRA